jgi:hypothetical protein
LGLRYKEIYVRRGDPDLDLKLVPFVRQSIKAASLGFIWGPKLLASDTFSKLGVSWPASYAEQRQVRVIVSRGEETGLAIIAALRSKFARNMAFCCNSRRKMYPAS